LRNEFNKATVVAMQATIISPAELIFPATYRRRVLALLLLHPDRRLHVREIARLTATVPGTLNRELARLHQAGLLEQERVGNQVQYGANTKSPVYEELASILRKTAGVADVLIEALAPFAETISCAFVFGSVARGGETAGSDVDVIVIGDAGFREVVSALYPAQAIIGRDVNPKVFSVKEWKAKVRAKDPFIREVLSKPKIVLIGDEHELEKPRRR
jgi:predicted nucleotidyltransferase